MSSNEVLYEDVYQPHEFLNSNLYQACNASGKTIKETLLNPVYPASYNIGSFVPKKYTIINEPVFYLRYIWETNYQHFIVEILPKLYNYLQLKKNIKDLKVVIGDKKWIHDLIDKVVDENDIIVQTENLLFKKVYFCPTTNINLRTPDENFYKITDVIKKVEYLSEEKELIFLDRMICPENRGNTRIITNKEELLSRLNPEIVFLENCTLQEKISKLSNTKTIITQHGANAMNLIFCSNIKNVIILCSDTFYASIDFYRKILSCNVYIFNSKNHDVFGENSPFSVDVERFMKFYSGLAL